MLADINGAGTEEKLNSLRFETAVTQGEKDPLDSMHASKLADMLCQLPEKAHVCFLHQESVTGLFLLTLV